MENRTPDLRIANATLYQLSYDPVFFGAAYSAAVKTARKAKSPVRVDQVAFRPSWRGHDQVEFSAARLTPAAGLDSLRDHETTARSPGPHPWCCLAARR